MKSTINKLYKIPNTAPLSASIYSDSELIKILIHTTGVSEYYFINHHEPAITYKTQCGSENGK